MTLYPDITHTCGHTPLVHIRSASRAAGAVIMGKLETFNPTASVKARVGVAMIEQGMASGKINPDTLIVEPTSGNTGIALAFAARVRGLKLVLTMPDTMSRERRLLLGHLGATLELTPGEQGMKGAIEKAQDILSKTPNAVMPDQFSNPANPDIHRRTTGPEIWDALNGNIDIFVAGVGTGGTITGVGQFLKQKNPQIKIIAVEPFGSPVLSGGKPGPHAIQGIGAGFIPANLDQTVLDEVVQVQDRQALEGARQLAADEGILCGISSGAAFHAAKVVGERLENQGRQIVFVVCDTGERYLSTDLFNKR